MKRKALATLLAVLVVAAVAVPAAYLLLRRGEGPAPTPHGTIPTNNPPIARISASATRILHNFDVSLDGTGSTDPDGDPLGFVWDFGDGTPPVEAPSVVHNYFEDGSFQVVLTVSDGKLSDTDTLTITVYNGPPVIESFFPASELVAIDEGRNLTFGVNASDPNLDELAYSWFVGSKPVGNGSRYTFVSDYKSQGVYEIRASVSDGKASASASWRLTVRNVNRPPKIETVDPLMDVTMAEGETVALRASASDADGDILSWVWVVDEGVRSNGTGPQAELIYRPDYRSSGVHRARVTFSDGSESASHSWNITVRNTNLPPEIVSYNPERDFSLPENSAQLFTVTALDPDGDPLSYSWSLNGAPVGSPQESHYTFITNYTSSGRYSLKVVVSDGRLNASTAWNITVTNVNRPPTARVSASPDEGPSGAPFLFDASASSDPDGEELRFEWDLGDGSGAEGARVSHSYIEPGRFRVSVTVRDPWGACSTASVNVTVLPGLSRVWALGAFTEHIVHMLIEDLDADGHRELVVALGAGVDESGVAHGRVVIYDLATRQEEWRSEDIGEPSALMAVSLDDDPALELIVGLELRVTADPYGMVEEGAIQIFDGATHSLEQQAAMPGAVTSVLVADLDLDLRKEILAGYIQTTSIDLAGGGMRLRGGLAAYDRSLNQIWNSTGWGLTLLAAAENIDGDAAVEIALATVSGFTIAGVVCNVSGFEWVTGEPVIKGELRGVLPSAFALADLNGDGVMEVLVGESERDDTTGSYRGCVYALDPGMTVNWRSANIGGVTALLAADIDGRAGPELCAGVVESENDEGDFRGRVVVFGSDWIELWRTGDVGQVSWLAAGDVNGDGVAELVAACVGSWSESGGANTTLRVFSGVGKKEIANATGLHEITAGFLLVDCDGDAPLEILLAEWLETEAAAYVRLYEM
ncbi:MAG: PKD domain-containing protein [Thermoplasmata archaeon]